MLNLWKMIPKKSLLKIKTIKKGNITILHVNTEVQHIVFVI